MQTNFEYQAEHQACPFEDIHVTITQPWISLSSP